MFGKSRMAMLQIVLLLATIIACKPQTYESHSVLTYAQTNLCELASDPAKYDGKMIRLWANLASLDTGPYLYGGCGTKYYFTLVDLGAYNSMGEGIRKLLDLSQSQDKSVKRLEADVIVTGVFDARYRREGFLGDSFRYKITPYHIEQTSPLRELRKLASE